MRRFLPLAALACLSAGCPKPEEKKPDAGSTSTPVIAVADAAAIHKAVPELVTTWGKDMHFKGPRSLVHDEVADRYLLSNVEGKPLDADKKAFISRLEPDGVGVTLKWIESGKNGVVLNAPKGMALTTTTLWVADIDTVRTFERATGKPTGDIPIKGATCLTDMAVNTNGDIVVVDAGLKEGASGLEPSGSDAVYAITTDKTVKTIAKGEDLKNPSGVLVYEDKIWVASYTTKEIAPLNPSGQRRLPQQLNGGKLDGMASIPGGDIFISSMGANAVLRGRPGKAFNPSIENVRSPADLAYDAKRNRLLVPSHEEDELRSYDIK